MKKIKGASIRSKLGKIRILFLEGSDPDPGFSQDGSGAGSSTLARRIGSGAEVYLGTFSALKKLNILYIFDRGNV